MELIQRSKTSTDDEPSEEIVALIRHVVKTDPEIAAMYDQRLQNLEQEMLGKIDTSKSERWKDNKDLMPSSKSSRLSSKALLTGADGNLEETTFTLMMLSPIFQTNKLCCFQHFSISKAWLIGLATFTLQIMLGVLIVSDQLHNDIVFLNVPIREPPIEVAIGQAITIPLTLLFQTDVLYAIRSIFVLRNSEGNPWDETLGIPEIEKTNATWIIRVLIPNLLKLSQGLVTILVTMIIIVQSENLIDLLKDFSALFLISAIDDAVYVLIDTGYLGQEMFIKAEEAKKAEIKNYRLSKNGLCIMRSIVLIIMSFMLGGWIYVIVGQNNGTFVQQKFPLCVGEFDLSAAGSNTTIVVGNGACDLEYNNYNCGYDAGDCEEFNQRLQNGMVVGNS